MQIYANEREISGLPSGPLCSPQGCIPGLQTSGLSLDPFIPFLKPLLFVRIWASRLTGLKLI